MKKRLFIVFIFAAVFSSLFGQNYVFDAAGILTDGEQSILEEKAGELSRKFDVGVYICIEDDFGGYDVESYSESLFTWLDFGLGQDNDGIMLYLSMAERDYDVCVHGQTGNDVFTVSARGKLEKSFLDDFRNNEWFKGFSDYLTTAEKQLVKYQKKIDSNGFYFDSTLFFESIGIGLAAGLLIALAACLIMKGSMKSVKLAKSASEYVERDKIAFPVREDRFTHFTETRRTIQSNNSSGGGRSGGFSHSSGKF